jgi:hypothetical protein
VKYRVPRSNTRTPSDGDTRERMQRRFRGPVIIATLLVVPVMILLSMDVDEPWDTSGTWATGRSGWSS